MPSFFKHDMETRFDTKKAKHLREEAEWREVCRVVDARDGRQCRCCGGKADPNATGITERGERHHIVYRSAGGKDVSTNLALLCAGCHNDEHKHRLRIEGNPDEKLTFYRKDAAGEWFTVREEIAVRQVRRD